MRRIKFLSMSMLAVLLFGAIVFTACKKKETEADKGKKAAQEFCGCLDKPTEVGQEACVLALDSKYNLDKYDEKSDFFKAFVGELLFCDGIWDLIDWEAKNITPPAKK